MGKAACNLTVYFEDPFWIGVFERIEDGGLSAAKVTFGAEPKDAEVLDYILKHYGQLRFSPVVAAAARARAVNPKRMQREARKQMHSAGIGTRSQQALKLQQEQFKQERRARTREEKLDEAKRMFALKQQKKKDKHRGH